MIPPIPTLFDVPVRRMNESESKFLLTASLAGASPPKTAPDLDAMLDDNTTFILKVLVKRLTLASDANVLEYDANTVIWCAYLANDNPGNAVMWAYSLIRKTRELGVITISRWCDLSPAGVPTREALRDVWDSQKGYVHGMKVDNILDTVEAYVP